MPNLPSRPPHLNLEHESQHLPQLWSAPDPRLLPPRMQLPVEEPVFQSDLARDLIGFPWRAVKRHRTLSISLFLIIAVAAGFSTIVMPRHYIVFTTLVASKNSVMPAIGNPQRSSLAESEAPTRLAAEAVMRRENLLEIIRETNLMAVQPRLRSPLGKLSAFFSEKVLGKKTTDDDRLKMVIGLLQTRMYVNTQDQGTVTIGIDWPDAASAFNLVQAAQQNFIEQRHASESNMIGESIEILKTHVVEARTHMQQALSDLKAARPDIVVSDPTRATAGGKKAATPAQQAQQAQAATLRTQLGNKQQLVRDLERSRAQDLTLAQTHLADLRRTYGPAYPEVTATEDKIKALEQDSPALGSARQDEAKIQSQLTALGSTDDDAPVASMSDATFARQMMERLTRARAADSSESPQVAYAQSSLKMATNEYEDYLSRLENAKIEQETASAAFKYRFNIVIPPEQPKKPAKPKVPLLILGGIFLGVAFGVFAATALDFISGRVVEKWQVQRQVGLPILATIPSEPWR
ncbi:MAG TPA: hypothetical protein VGM82_05380 [Gemmatimonadaceae bacterium]|jgi:uncharacterized protein involved in exopolysaccharide biosynthesis